jgi:hypothetical protein
VSIWRTKAWLRRTFPVAVSRKRFTALRLLFIFGIE